MPMFWPYDRVPEPPATKELAANAAAVMRERGYARRALKDEHGRVCVRGAVNIAISGNPFVGYIAADFEGEFMRIVYRNFPQWVMDHPSSTSRSGVAYFNNTTDEESVLSVLDELAIGV